MKLRARGDAAQLVANRQGLVSWKKKKKKKFSEQGSFAVWLLHVVTVTRRGTTCLAPAVKTA